MKGALLQRLTPLIMSASRYIRPSPFGWKATAGLAIDAALAAND